MRLALEIIFWASLGLVALPFVLYRVGIALLAMLRPRPINKSDRESESLPMVTFVMAAYNEEAIIEGRLENFLQLDYPSDRLRFLVGSDSSTDGTDAICRRFAEADDRIVFRRFPKSGKTRIVYELARGIEEGIVIFTDADALLASDAVREIVRCFADPTVGGVVVNVGYRELEVNAGSVGERSYHGAENRIRRAESLVDSTLGPTGQCFAVRHDAYTELEDVRMSDDLNLAITVRLNGYRVWFEPDARVTEVNRRTLSSEFRRRTRMGRQSMATYRGYRGTKWPWSSSTGLRLWLHKIPRNLAGLFAGLFALSAASLAILEAGDHFLVAALLCGAWILVVLVGAVLDRIGLQARFLLYPLYFSAMVAALAIGSLRAILSGSGLAEWSSPRIEETKTPQ